MVPEISATLEYQKIKETFIWIIHVLTHQLIYNWKFYIFILDCCITTGGYCATLGHTTNYVDLNRAKPDLFLFFEWNLGQTLSTGISRKLLVYSKAWKYLDYDKHGIDNISNI